MTAPMSEIEELIEQRDELAAKFHEHNAVYSRLDFKLDMALAARRAGDVPDMTGLESAVVQKARVWADMDALKIKLGRLDQRIRNAIDFQHTAALSEVHSLNLARLDALRYLPPGERPTKVSQVEGALRNLQARLEEERE